MKQDARNMDDRQERYELFTLIEGEEKVTMEWDLRLPNTAIFTFAREDHTLGNLLTSALLDTDHVVFAAYKVPHPLFPTFTLRISTDATIGPKEALTTAPGSPHVPRVHIFGLLVIGVPPSEVWGVLKKGDDQIKSVSQLSFIASRTLIHMLN